MAEKGIATVKRVVSILNSVDYGRYSEKRAKTYPEYAGGAWKDERKLISPIVFPKFLEQVLGFRLGETIGTQETVAAGGDIPDYIPVDTRTHPFVFDCKGMDCDNLSKWYDQIRRYLEVQELRYGVLTNMRDMDVYTLESHEEIETFNFNFVELYNDYREDATHVLEKDNTKRFLRFVERFRHITLTTDQKLQRAAQARPWTGQETLNVDLLTRRLHHVVEAIREDAATNKDALIMLKQADPDRATAIAQEIELIASELERGSEVTEASLETFEQILKAPARSLLGRALDVFLNRVGYFTMTRLLLARAWEDIGFIDQTLYDGGLTHWYENFNREIRRVLRYAFGLAAERYKWLFNVDNNYTWYEPSDDTLVEVLYEMSNFNLGQLNQDVLGTIYEQYIDKVDRKRKGQYYTPREIIELIWNRVGFTGPKAFFWMIGGRRRPKFIFDPAAGSGGFLVEAARRVRDESGVDWDEFRDLLDIRTAILAYIFGSEVSIFPYYIAEVNVLIQLTPVVKRMMELRRGLRESLPLGIVPVDALSLYNPDPTLVPERPHEFERTRDILPLERQKKAVFQKIKSEFDGKFSYCCANPPYIGEKGNKELFRSTLQRFPYWRRFYQGKMDYLYFFIILGLSKLRGPSVAMPGGKLGFITTAYWPTADGASRLRKYILQNATIREMIFFEDVRIFEYAKGQHNMVFVLEKCPGKERQKERRLNRIKIARVRAKHADVPGKSIREKLRFLTHHIQEHIDETKWCDDYIEVFWSGMKQGDLSQEGGPWNLKHSRDLQEILNRIRSRGASLSSIFEVDCGVQTSADEVTSKNIGHIPEKWLRERGVQKGDGIFVLRAEAIERLRPSDQEMELVKPFYKNVDMGSYVLDPVRPREELCLIYVTRHTEIDRHPVIKSHLERFRPILEQRRECLKGTLPWYSIHWPRREHIFEGEKLVAPHYRYPRPFLYANTPYYTNMENFILKKKRDSNEEILYFLGLLNSSLLDVWYTNTFKYKASGYEFSKSRIETIPLHRIDFDDAAEAKLHDDIVDKVKSICKRMTELASYSKYFRRTRLTRLESGQPLPEASDEAIARSLPTDRLRSIRTHPDIEVLSGPSLEEDKFILKKVGSVTLTLEGPELTLIGGNRQAIVLKGAEEVLTIISSILEDHQTECWTSIKELPVVPAAARDHEEKKQKVTREVVTCRTEIQKLQTSIDNIVLRLYGLSEELAKRAK